MLPGTQTAARRLICYNKPLWLTRNTIVLSNPHASGVKSQELFLPDLLVQVLCFGWVKVIPHELALVLRNGPGHVPFITMDAVMRRPGLHLASENPTQHMLKRLQRRNYHSVTVSKQNTSNLPLFPFLLLYQAFVSASFPHRRLHWVHAEQVARKRAGIIKLDRSHKQQEKKEI